MNKYIELVKKWLANKESVSQEELEVNAAAAYFAACDAADAYDYAADAYDYAAYHAANAAYYAAYDAAYDTEAADAAHWVKRYEEISK